MSTRRTFFMTPVMIIKKKINKNKTKTKTTKKKKKKNQTKKKKPLLISMLFGASILTYSSAGQHPRLFLFIYLFKLLISFIVDLLYGILHYFFLFFVFIFVFCFVFVLGCDHQWPLGLLITSPYHLYRIFKKIICCFCT